MKHSKRYIYIKYGILIFILIIIIPIFMDLFIIGNDVPSNIDNGDWVTFLGSYIGSIIGAITTLIGIMITLDFTRKQTNEERRLEFAPYLKFTMKEKTFIDKKHDIHIYHIIDDDDTTYVNTTISLKNIGKGPLLDLSIYNITYKDKAFSYTIDGSNDILESGSEFFMLIDLRLRLDEIKNEMLVKNSPGSLTEYSPPPDCLQKGGVLSLNIGYKDIMLNQYEQDIEITMVMACESKPNEIGYKYCKPELFLTKVGKRYDLR